MSLYEIQREQEEAKRIKPIMDFVQQQLAHFSQKGSRQILELAAGVLRQKGLDVDVDSSNYSRHLEVRGSSQILRASILLFNPVSIEGTKVKWSYVRDGSELGVARTSVGSSSVPVIIPELHYYGPLHDSAGFFWTGPEDNERIAKALVRVMVKGKARGDFRPRPWWWNLS